jgi:hypothetical protein
VAVGLRWESQLQRPRQSDESITKARKISKFGINDLGTLVNGFDVVRRMATWGKCWHGCYKEKATKSVAT